MSITTKAKSGALSVQDVAKLLSVSESTVTAWISSKKLKAYRLDGSKRQTIVRILRCDLEEYLSIRETGT